MSLTEEERRELEVISNPQVQYEGSPAFGIWAILTRMFNQDNLSRRRSRFIELKAKMRMSELNLNPSQNYNEYLKIKTEEEENFENIFRPNSDKAIELRTKRRMFDLSLDPQRDYQEYYRIRKEEENRFSQKTN